MIAATALALAGCTSSAPRQTPIGTGWSRAPDLSVYTAMRTAGEIAREQDILCWGRNPAEVDALWHSRFNAREAWIAAALERRYGPAATRASGPLRVGRARCPTFDTGNWHRHHAELLRTLELRLYPKDYWSAG